MSLKTSAVNGINLIYGHRSFPAVFGSPVQGWCDWRWGSPVELIGVGREWEFPARLCWGNWACLAWGRRGLGRPSSSLPWFQGSMGSNCTEWRKGLNHGANGTWCNLSSDCSIGSRVGLRALGTSPWWLWKVDEDLQQNFRIDKPAWTSLRLCFKLWSRYKDTQWQNLFQEQFFC